jgi:hypothetical protein
MEYPSTDYMIRYAGKPQLPHPTDVYITGAAAQTALNNNVLLATAGTEALDTLGYRSMSVHLQTSAGIAGGVITFEGSNDNVNFITLFMWDGQGTTYGNAAITSHTLAASSVRLIFGACNVRYIRFRISTVVSGGTVQAFTVLHPATFAQHHVTTDITRILSNTITAGAGQATSGSQRVVLAGQCSNHRFVGANTTNSLNIKNTAGTLWSVQAANINAAVRYLKLYDKATAPTVGTDTPIVVIPLPTGAANVNVVFPEGLNFTLGLGRGLVTGILDSDATAPAASEQVVSIQYT